MGGSVVGFWMQNAYVTPRNVAGTSTMVACSRGRTELFELLGGDCSCLPLHLLLPLTLCVLMVLIYDELLEFLRCYHIAAIHRLT